MKFLLMLNVENNKNKEINKDRLFFIIYSILTQNKNTELLISECYRIFRDYDNKPLLEQINELSKYAKNFRIEHKNYGDYNLVNIEYLGEK